MQDDEACILVVVVADDAYQFAPGIGVHVRGIHGWVELISVDTERKSLKFGNMFCNCSKLKLSRAPVSAFSIIPIVPPVYISKTEVFLGSCALFFHVFHANIMIYIENDSKMLEKNKRIYRKRYGKCESVSRKLCIFLAFLEAFCIFIAKSRKK